MTIGTIDFKIKSGFSTPIDAIPIPALAVPYAAPTSKHDYILYILLAKPSAIATPR